METPSMAVKLTRHYVICRRGVEETDQVFPLPLESLRIGEDNVITVLQDNMGVNQLGC